MISKNPSPSADGTNFESDFNFDDGRRVDGVDVNQLNVVIGISVVVVDVVVVVVVVVIVAVVVVVINESSMKEERSRTLSGSSRPNCESSNWLI